MKVTGIETLHCDAGWRNYNFVKLDDRRGHRRLERVRRGLRLARRHRGDRAARRARRRPGRRRRTSASTPSSTAPTRPARGRRRRRGDGRDRERAARRQGQGARRAVLRAARRQAARPHPASTGRTAPRGASTIPSCYQAGDHRPRRRQGDRPRGAREGFQRAQDQHLHLRGRPAAAAGARASACRSIPSSTSTRRCCAICACISRRSATAPGRTSICCSTSISTPRPKAI